MNIDIENNRRSMMCVRFYDDAFKSEELQEEKIYEYLCKNNFIDDTSQDKYMFIKFFRLGRSKKNYFEMKNDVKLRYGHKCIELLYYTN